MNPDLDRQPRQPPGRWPFPGDTPLVRARKIAHMYRAALGAANARMRDECDATATGYGETWVVPRVITADDDDLLDAVDAADWLCVSLARVRALRLAGRLAGVQVDGRWRYRLADLRALQTATRQGRRTVDQRFA